jgi:hypothetical protein
VINENWRFAVRIQFTSGALLAAVLWACPSRAEVIDLIPPGHSETIGLGFGTTINNGVVFEVNESFVLSSLGFRFDPVIPNPFTIQAQLYEILPGTVTRGQLLVSGPGIAFADRHTIEPPVSLLDWYDLPIAANLTAGSRYELTLNSLVVPPGSAVEFFGFFPDYFSVLVGGNDPTFDVGPITVLAQVRNGEPALGFQHFRLNAVPEPSSLILTALGAAGLGLSRRRRKL